MDYSDKIKELNPPDLPMTECDYYKFFDEVGFIDNRIEAKRAYLSNRFNFVIGTDSIDEYTINTLNTISDFYFIYNHPKNNEETSWLEQK